jgi:hypothetical protein
MFISDETTEVSAEVNSLKELKVQDSSLVTLQTTSVTLQTQSLTKLNDIETAIQAVETNQTDGTQITNIKGAVDTGNSTSTPLPGDTGGSDHIFTGVAIDILNCGILFVNIYTDAASATDGLSIQQSSDGTNWDHTDDYTIAAGATKNFSINPHSQYFRVVYTNGVGAQSVFRLQTVCKSQNAKPSSHRVKDEIIGDDDVTLVKAALTGENGDGLWHNVKTTADGNLTISDNSSGLAIAKGDVTGSTFVSKFGQNEAVGTAAYEDIWDGGGTYTYPVDSTAPITHIYSTGVDVQPIEVQGLDVNGELVVQTKTLTGATVAALDTALWRVFRMKNTGSVDILTGSVVHASDAGKSVSYAQIVNGNNQTLMALYTIPAGYTGYLVMGGASLVGLNRSYSMDGHFYMRDFGGVFKLKHTFGVNSNGTSTFQHEYKIPLPIAEKTDLRVRAVSSAAGGVLNATFDIVLVEN